MGFFSKIFGGGKRRAPEPPKITQAPTVSPFQKESLDEILKLSLENIKDPYKGFEPIAQQAQGRFERETVPSLAERFTSMGQAGQRSSGFQQALGGSGVQLEELLSGLMSQYGQQSLQNYGNLASLGAKPQFENIVQNQPMQQQGMGFGQQLMGGLGNLAMGGFSGHGGLLGRSGGLGKLFRRF